MSPSTVAADEPDPEKRRDDAASGTGATPDVAAAFRGLLASVKTWWESIPSNDSGSGGSAEIFMSYRRADSCDATGRLHDRLARYFGAKNVFYDVTTIPAGTDYAKHIRASIKKCKVLLAIIGPHWLAVNEVLRRRIDDPNDLVRIEIEMAIECQVPIIPVLVGKGVMPTARQVPHCIRDLTYLNAIRVDSGADFHFHVDRLITLVDFVRSGGK